MKKKKKKKKKNEGHPFLLNTSGGDPQGQITEKTIYIERELYFYSVHSTSLYLHAIRGFLCPKSNGTPAARPPHQSKVLGVGGMGFGEGREAPSGEGASLPSPILSLIHHLHSTSQNKTPSGIAAFGGFGGVPVRHPRTRTYCT